LVLLFLFLRISDLQRRIYKAIIDLLGQLNIGCAPLALRPPVTKPDVAHFLAADEASGFKLGLHFWLTLMKFS